MNSTERAEIVARMLTLIPENEYTYRVPGIIAQQFPLETLSLKLGVKVSFTFSHHRGIPVHMEAMRGRGWAILSPVHDRTHHLLVDGVPYLMDPCGGEKINAALRLAVTAFLRSESPAQAAELLGKGGTCCCCGASLTDPVSISRGIGPECFRKAATGFWLRRSFGG